MKKQKHSGIRDRGYTLLAFLFLGQTLLLVWTGVLRPGRMVVKGVDPVCYYAYTRSILFDRDLDFRNEFEQLQEGGLPPIEETPTGRVANVFSIGPGLFLMPFFLAGHGYAAITGYEPRDGYSSPYMVASFVGLAVYGLLGILFSYAAVRRLYPMNTAVLAVLGGWLATSVVYYIYPIALMPHTVSFFLVALFLWIWLRARERYVSKGQWFLLGILGGLMMLARWQNAIFLVIPVVDRWFEQRKGRGESVLTPTLSQGEREAVSSPSLAGKGAGGLGSRSFPPGAEREPSSPPYQGGAGGGLIFLAGVFIAFLPQLAAWQIIFGRPFLIPQGGGFLLWLQPKIHLLLFSRHNGLITWTPITIFALIGIVMFARKRKWRSLGVAFGVVVLAQIYLNSIVVDWYAGMGFGMRRLVGSMPILMIGLAAFLHWLSGKIKGWQVAVLVGLFILWNALFLTQYYTGLVPWDRPATWHELLLDKIRIVQALQRHTLQRAAVASVYGGDPRNGLSYAREAVDLGPYSPEARMALALAEARMGSRKPAAAELRAAADILGGTEYVRTKFSSMLRRAGMGNEVGYYEGELRDLD